MRCISGTTKETKNVKKPTLTEQGNNQVVQVEEKKYEMVTKFDHRFFHVIFQLMTVVNLCRIEDSYVSCGFIDVSEIQPP